jgi:multidrug efflux pump subunit AcrA (membrane-fusion protein)
MKTLPKNLIFSLLLIAALTGCEKPAADDSQESVPEIEREENIVTLTPENLQHVTIQTASAQPERMEVTLKTAGRVSANANRTARITPTLEGRLVQFKFDLNDHVEAGEVVAIVESPELLGRPLELNAPLAGVIIERAAAIGELIAKGQSVGTISDLRELWVIAEVTERDIARVKPGQESAFTVPAYPGETFHGQVALVEHHVEPQSRTVEVRILTDNADARLKPGMFADVEIVTAIRDDVLTVPESALQTDGENQIVFVALADRRFERREVKRGLERAGRVEILEGLKPGETIVTEGSFILKSEMLKDQLGEE